MPVVISGDGLVGAIGGAMAGSETPLGIIPGGRGNDLARVLGIPDDPEAAVAVLLAGETRRIDVGEANGKRFLGIVSVGFDSEANRLANETHFLRGNLVYAYAALRTLIGWKPARFTVRVDDERDRFTGYSVSVANNKAFGGGMFIAPDAELDDGEFDVVAVGEVGKLRFLANLPKVFKGTHVEEDEVRVFRAPHLELSASRPFPVYADGEHLTDLPASLRVLPRALSVIVPPGRGLSAAAGTGPCSAPSVAAARAVGAASRASGRGGGTTLPGRVLLRLAPDAIARLGAGLDGGATLVSATNGKTTTAGMIAADPRRRRPRPGPQPGRLEHDLGRRDGAARAARRARGSSRSTRPGCRRWRPQLDPSLIVLGNLFRDQLDRYGEIETPGRRVGRRWSPRAPAAPASSSTPTTR